MSFFRQLLEVLRSMIIYKINDKLTVIPTCFSNFSVENLGAIGKSIGSVAPSA